MVFVEIRFMSVLVPVVIVVIAVVDTFSMVAIAMAGVPLVFDLGFDGFVRAVEQTVAVTLFVAAGRVILAASSLELDVAGVVAEEYEVV
jgi:hypothetical protein